jgi:ribosomal protein S27E
VPVYVLCPHCEHPHVIPPHRLGRKLFCRQCGRVYASSEDGNRVEPLAISSLSQLRKTGRFGRKENLYIIET